MTRRRYLAVTGLAALGIVVMSVIEMPVKLIWNATASVPLGLYRVEHGDTLAVSDLVAVMPPEPLAIFMIARGYIGGRLPLLKRILGLPGQRVCRSGNAIRIDGIKMGEALERDRMGRRLPVWQGCRVIRHSEIFLMNWQVRDSLDGRYFGPIPANSIIGRALPLWTDEDGDGRFVWRVPAH